MSLGASHQGLLATCTNSWFGASLSIGVFYTLEVLTALPAGVLSEFS